MEIINWSLFLLPYMQAVDELKLKFTNLRRDFQSAGQHSPIESVEGRVKRAGAILNKAKRKNIGYDQITESIEDIAGVRIICRFVEDIERVVEMIRERDGADLYVKDERDYVENTKSSGYRSYHIHVAYPMLTVGGPITVAAEIQIRTMAMDFWATIEHSLKYKYSGHIPEGVQSRLRNAAEASFLLDKEMGHIRGEIVEANETMSRRNDLVDQILKNVEKLHFQVKFDKANDLNRQFMEIYEEGNLERLIGFNNQLNTIARVYSAE
jgi:putative GTP pyrophosphokinase